MNLKVALATTELMDDSIDDSLQKVANVYTDGADYRVYAPAQAKGPATEWASYFLVKQSGAWGETNVSNAIRDVSIRAVTEVLKRYKVEHAFDGIKSMIYEVAIDLTGTVIVKLMKP